MVEMFVGVVDGSKARPVWLTEVRANLRMEVVLILSPVGVVYLYSNETFKINVEYSYKTTGAHSMLFVQVSQPQKCTTSRLSSETPSAVNSVALGFDVG